MSVPSDTSDVRFAVSVRQGAREGLSIDDLSRIEWLLTDGHGGFAMGTAAGIPTRRYHGWFIPALTPPLGRAVMLHSAIERLVLEVTESEPEEAIDFSTFRFPGDVLHPRGVDHLVRFVRQASAVWTYEIPRVSGTLTVTRELVLLGPTGVSIRYTIAGLKTRERRARLEVRPLVAMRDFHEVTSGRHADSSRFAVGSTPGTVTVRAQRSGLLEIPALSLSLRSAREQSMFGGPAQWWNDFEYARDRDRGQSFREDLYSPGAFVARCEDAELPGLAQFELRAWIGEPIAIAADHAERTQVQRISAIAAKVMPLAIDADRRAGITALVGAADQFIARRRLGEWLSTDGRPREAASVIAGFPWFSDWGRDAMISLPGLLLTTGRFAEVRSVLEGFAAMCRNGLIPNCFSNQTGAPEYNTVDASLWFIHAACRYASVARDAAVAGDSIGNACIQIIEAYQRGTDFNIRVDPSDGLVAAGDPTMQLTWMDAKRDGVVFTPRAGKAVEINALWYNALVSTADLLEASRPRTSRDLRQVAERVRVSFQAKFFDAYRRMCFDMVPGTFSWPGGAGYGDPAYQVRPNQIFAVSLPHSPLNAEQQEAVVKAVRGSLLTPMGLRTLAPSDREYQGRYEGSLFARDRAYHNGTVWPWLIGPLAEAVMRVGQFSAGSRADAIRMMAPLMDELLTPRPGRAIGQLSEVYDGDDSPEHPRRADGCPAQAWSVAELLRVYVIAMQ
ncbi:MAG: glycogen debranching enzyme family protein [Phycisphaerales bacterium]|nr:glycogen debranching enzyme family protein [Phycisphaerales bacterium]